MKKVILASIISLMSVVSIDAQIGNFKIGAHVGMITGDQSDYYNLNLGADISYLMPISENFTLGGTTGYSYYIGKEIECSNVENLEIIPIAASAEYLFTPQFYVGLDLGYAFFMQEESDNGDLYYQPKVGYKFTEANELYVAYRGLSLNDTTMSTIDLGYAYTFGK